MAPPMVKLYLALCVGVTALVQTGRLSPAWLALSPRVLPPDLELWRPFSALTFGGGFTPSWLVSLHLLSHYGAQLERAASATRGAVWASLDQYHIIGWILIGAGFMLAATLTRPNELLQPFLMTAAVFFFGTLCSYLPQPGSTRARLDLSPWIALIALALAVGPASAMREIVGIGAALIVHLAEVLPVMAADDAQSFQRVPRSPARRAAIGAALVASLLLGMSGVDLSARPIPNARLLDAQSVALSEALVIDPSAEFFEALANSSNVSVVMAGRRGNASAPARGLAPAQLLRVFQHCADFWSTQHHRARLFNTVRQKRGGAALTSNEQLLNELERDLAEVLSQVDFKAEPRDEQVLKNALRELPRPELQSLMPRAKMLETVAAHRESHVTAHEALALLGALINDYVHSLAEETATIETGAAGNQSTNAANEALDSGAEEHTAHVQVSADGSVSVAPDSLNATSDGDGAMNAESSNSSLVGTGTAKDPESLRSSLREQLKTTLSAFSVPLEMTDAEVLTELMPPEVALQSGTRAELLAEVHELRTQLRDEAIARSVEDLRIRIALPNALTMFDGSATAPSINDASALSGRSSLVLNETARIESTSLALELLTFHEADTAMGEEAMVTELLNLANLTALQTKEGTLAALAEAAQSWKLLSRAQDAVASLRNVFLRGLVPSADLRESIFGDQEPATEGATAAAGEPEEQADATDEATTEAMGERPEEMSGSAGVARSGPVSWAEHAAIPSLVETAMLGYEFPPLMSSDDIVSYLLKLMKLDHLNIPTSFGPRAWLESAVIAARAKGTHASVTATATTSNVESSAPQPLLLPQLRDTTAAGIIGGAATAVSDDHFAILVAAVMQAVGVHTRLMIGCDPPLAPTDVTAAGGEGLAESDGGAAATQPLCHAVAEVRVGKSAQKLGRWIAQHRKGQRALRKSVRGAIEINFRRDHLGFLWLPLRWRPGAAEQVPGAAYSNSSFSMIYFEPGRYVVEGEPLDSRGMATGREKHDKVLCTL